MEPFATREEVATHLGIDPRTLDNWAYSDQGPTYYKIGNRRMYKWTDVNDWIETRKVTPK